MNNIIHYSNGNFVKSTLGALSLCVIATPDQSLPSGSVNVLLPSFWVSVNDERRQIPNQSRKYPVLDKDITYFPDDLELYSCIGIGNKLEYRYRFSIRKSSNKAVSLGNEENCC